MVIGSAFVLVFIAAAVGTFFRYITQKIPWPDWATFFVGLFVFGLIVFAAPIVITIR